MRLLELVNIFENVSPEAARHSFIGHLKELSAKVSNSAMNIRHGGGSKGADMSIANWITTNLQGDRKSGGIQSAARGLMHGMPPHAKEQLQRIAAIKITARQGGNDKLGMVGEIMNALKHFKDATDDDHLKAAIIQLEHDFENLDKEKADAEAREAENGDDAPMDAPKKGKRGRPAGARNKSVGGSKEVLGAQAKVAEETFQAIVKTLPPTVAQKVREATKGMEASAKLAYLKKLM